MKRLIEQLANAEQKLVQTKFIAPRLSRGKVLVRIGGLVSAFRPEPDEFEGWGIFRVEPDFTAKLVKEAGRAQKDLYLERLLRVKVILLRPLRGSSWLAYPAFRGDFEQRVGKAAPVAVHLVARGRAFEQVVARWDGKAFWFDRGDRKADPRIPGRMANALKAFLSPEALRFPGLTPELREAYRVILKQEGDLRVRCGEERLRKALELGGGRLESFVDGGDYWTTHWVTGDGRRHTSAIQKDDLTVLSAGICLAGEDDKFDLQSLVGVVEQA